MSDANLMDGGAANGGARAESLGERAREAIAHAIRRTPPGQERNVLVAGLALRLAELGHAKEVSVKVAGGEEAARAALAFLAEMEIGPRRPRPPKPQRSWPGRVTGRPGSGARFGKRARSVRRASSRAPRTTGSMPPLRNSDMWALRGSVHREPKPRATASVLLVIVPEQGPTSPEPPDERAGVDAPG
jgi:hypothetical protein